MKGKDLQGEDSKAPTGLSPCVVKIVLLPGPVLVPLTDLVRPLLPMLILLRKLAFLVPTGVGHQEVGLPLYQLKQGSIAHDVPCVC